MRVFDEQQIIAISLGDNFGFERFLQFQTVRVPNASYASNF
jgi:hypothetical protein